MDQNIKNRLVGIAVISSLVVIFLPMILDGSGIENTDLNVDIPPQPVAVASDAEFVVKQLELEQKIDDLPELQPRFVDENSATDRESAEMASDTDDDATTSGENGGDGSFSWKDTLFVNGFDGAWPA